jgi:hypothetical protein
MWAWLSQPDRGQFAERLDGFRQLAPLTALRQIAPAVAQTHTLSAPTDHALEVIQIWADAIEAVGQERLEISRSDVEQIIRALSGRWASMEIANADQLTEAKDAATGLITAWWWTDNRLAEHAEAVGERTRATHVPHYLVLRNDSYRVMHWADAADPSKPLCGQPGNWTPGGETRLLATVACSGCASRHSDGMPAVSTLRTDVSILDWVEGVFEDEASAIVPAFDCQPGRELQWLNEVCQTEAVKALMGLATFRVANHYDRERFSAHRHELEELFAAGATPAQLAEQVGQWFDRACGT